MINIPYLNQLIIYTSAGFDRNCRLYNAKKIIAESLAMKTNCVKIFASLNRPNIRLSLYKTNKSDIFTKLNCLISIVKTKGYHTPKRINILEYNDRHCKHIEHLLMVLGENYPNSSRKACECLVGVYHANTGTHAKEKIVSSLKNVNESAKRIIIASAACELFLCSRRKRGGVVIKIACIPLFV